MIFDHDGTVISSHQLEHQQILPQAGWVEHNSAEIWDRTVEVITGALNKAGLTGGDLAAIGITNQRETTVAWDSSTGLPLHNAIVWQDTRTAEFLSALPSHTQKLITEKTGLPVAPYFSASKANWLLRNVPAVQEALTNNRLHIGTIDSWLLWKLTGGPHGGVFATDVTNASRTMLMDLETLQWDQALLDTFEIPLQALPQIKPSSHIFGHTDPAGPLGASVPIGALLGDQHAAMVGQLCFERGQSKTTYGTGNFALLHTGAEIVRSQNGLLSTVCYQFEGHPVQYALEGSVAVTGAAIQWLRDQLGIIGKASEIEALAATVPDTQGVYFVPAFSGLFAPYWRSDARGVIVGLTRASTKAHLARAALESICYQTRDVLDAMVADSGVAMMQMRVDGGATENSLLMQMQSDVMGIDLVRPLITETTSLGAAYAAGIAVGFWRDLDQLRELGRQSQRWSCTSTPQDRSQGYAEWKKAIERTLNWA